MSSPRSLIIAEVRSSQSGARCADVRAVMPPAIAPRSTTITFWPSIASSYAVDIPAIPEPITIVSHDRLPSSSRASGATSMSIHSEQERLSKELVIEGQHCEKTVCVIKFDHICSIQACVRCLPLLTLRTAPSPLQQQAQLECVGRSCALLVVVEIDKDIAPLPFPRAYSVAPLSQRLGTVVTFIAATGTVTPDVDEIGCAFPRRRRVVMVGNAKRDILVGEQSEYLWHIPARMAKFEAVSAFLRQQLEERCQPFGIGLKLRRQLKQDRAGFLAKQR